MPLAMKGAASKQSPLPQTLSLTRTVEQRRASWMAIIAGHVVTDDDTSIGA